MVGRNDELCLCHNSKWPKTTIQNATRHVSKDSKCPLVGDATLLLVLRVLHLCRAYTQERDCRDLLKRMSVVASQQVFSI